MKKRELLLLRHGKSDWNVDVDDFQRPLKDRGKRGAQRIGVWLLQQNLEPDLILSSPAERARVTAEKTSKVMNVPAKSIRLIPELYAAGLSTLLGILETVSPEYRRVLLVGHNPGLEQLLIHLANSAIPQQKDGKLLATATLAHLQTPGNWTLLKPACAKLLAIQRGADLPDGFPYPNPDSKEQRPRPAYYYQQSSVIPYRFNAGEMEILITLSSQKKHWVIPKGIQDPGSTPQDSAAKEALEEAGVEGIVTPEPLGSYQYEKWGATCTVAVFPMQVTRMIPEHAWEENHRGRLWVSPAEAAEKLKQKALLPMLETLVKRAEETQ